MTGLAGEALLEQCADRPETAAPGGLAVPSEDR
jgi:hypothetical protein